MKPRNLILIPKKFSMKKLFQNFSLFLVYSVRKICTSEFVLKICTSKLSYKLGSCYKINQEVVIKFQLAITSNKLEYVTYNKIHILILVFFVQSIPVYVYVKIHILILVLLLTHLALKMLQNYFIYS